MGLAGLQFGLEYGAADQGLTCLVMTAVGLSGLPVTGWADKGDRESATALVCT